MAGSEVRKVVWKDRDDATAQLLELLAESAGAHVIVCDNFHEATRRFQKAMIESELSKTHGKVAPAARSLGLTRSHMYNLMRAFGMMRDGSSK